MELFKLGRLVATKRVWELIDTNERFSRFVTGCLTRYVVYDWGELDPDDWAINEEAVKTGERILASYPLPYDVEVDYDDRLWIITEADRSVTTLLFPGDY
jgi:hypothetical protein